MPASTTPPRPGPGHGDCIISRRSSSLVYELSQVGRPVQVAAGSLREALRLARGFAEDRRVSVWLTEDAGQHYVRVDLADADVS